MLHINYQHCCTFSVIMCALQLAHDKDFSFLTKQQYFGQKVRFIQVPQKKKKKSLNMLHFVPLTFFIQYFVCFYYLFCILLLATCFAFWDPQKSLERWFVFILQDVLSFLVSNAVVNVRFAQHCTIGVGQQALHSRFQEKYTMFLKQAIHVLNPLFILFCFAHAAFLTLFSNMNEKLGSC